MRKLCNVAVVLVVVFVAAGVGYGSPGFATSFKSTYPSSPLSSLSTVSGVAGNLCTVCHGASGPPLNPYGDAYLSYGSFSAIQGFDSDIDGYTNLVEINAGSFPGNAASVPPPDVTAPIVTAFTIPTTAASLTVPITTFTATDAGGVTGYMVNESAIKPLAAAAGWTATRPASYTCTTAGAKTLYAWAKDAANNVSTSRSANVTITLPDTTAPVVIAFTIPATTQGLTVSIVSFAATDLVGVTGYLITENATKPAAAAAGWTAAAPTTYTSTTLGLKTLYGWAKDAAGNVSNSLSMVVSMQARPGDINADGHVDSLDLLPFATSWGKSTGAAGFNATCDLNSDGRVDVLDLLILAGNWGT
jgi:hypothetical protein